MSYNSHENTFLYCFYQFPEVFIIELIMIFSDEAKLTYIPLSSIIVLLIILLTCASRRKKISAFGALEKNINDDIKGEYAVMCFPCLKKKPDMTNFDSSIDLTDQFEYVVEKYTIRKVPFLLANTVEDIIERSEELEMAKAQSNRGSSNELGNSDFENFQVAQDTYDDRNFIPCITVAANTVCSGKKPCKERPKPSDILESMSPVTRYPVRNHNYVVIPTKGSLRHKDIMLTKREITTQYLNNFSSVFIDNLKDQIPKDPDQFPNLSRPYTSAFKNYPIAPASQGKSSTKKSKKDKIHRVAYSFPSQETFRNEGNSNVAEQYYDSDSVPDQATDITESEFQENINNEQLEYTSATTITKGRSTPAIKDKHFDTDLGKPCEYDDDKKDQTNTKNVTYEDIQALDLGYEFNSCEKFGVKPKMTRIHYPYETEKLVETIKQLALGETVRMSKRSSLQDYPLSPNSTRSSIPDKTARFPTKPLNSTTRSMQLPLPAFGSPFVPPVKEFPTNRITETSFLSVKDRENPKQKSQIPSISLETDHLSTLTFTTRSLCASKSRSANDLKEREHGARDLVDSITEISKLYDLTMPISQNYERNPDYEPDSKDFHFPAPSKSRSFQESGSPGPRRETVPGKTSIAFNLGKQSNILESETETTTSLFSPESKTSTGIASPISSETQDCKQATLRWKIIIKHHRHNSSSKKVVKKFPADG